MSGSRTRSVIALAVVLSLAFALRLYRLDHQSFWIDEVYQVQAASEPVSNLMQSVVLHAEGGPLSLLLTHFALSAERPEWSARFPSVLFGTVGVLILYLVAATLFAPPIPILSALLLACAPLHVWYSQEARWYAPWVPITALSYLALIHAVRTRRAGAWLAYGFVAIVGLYTFVLGVAVVASQAVSAWWLNRLRSDRRGVSRGELWVGIGALVLAAPVVWLMINHHQAMTGTRGRPVPFAVLPYTLFAYTMGFSFGPTLEYLHHYPALSEVVASYPEVLVVAAVIAPLVILGILNLRHAPEAMAVVLPWLCGPPLLIFVLAYNTNVAYNVRYTLAALPAFIVVLAVGITAVSPRWLGGVALAAVLVCFAVSIGNYFFDPRFAKEDVKGALASIRRTPQREAPVVALGQIESAVWYYGPDLHVVSFFGCDEFEARLEKAGLGAARTLWVVRGRDYDDASAPCIDDLKRRFAVEQSSHPVGVEVQLLERRDG